MSRQECVALRGIAITSIIMHNYCHWLPDAVMENEFLFINSHYIDFFSNINLYNALYQFFSFFGHMGVPVFVMFSGYGLTKKYDNIMSVKPIPFIHSHYMKLIIPLTLGLIAFFTTTHFLYHHVHYTILQLIAQLTLTINIAPHPENLILPGPYWYFGMTMQLYVIYILVIYKRPTRHIFIFTLFVFIVTIFLGNKHYTTLWIRHNSFGWLLPFLFGVLLGRKQIIIPQKMKALSVFLTAIVLIFIFESNYFTWLITPLIVVICAISFVQVLPVFIKNVFYFIGNISLYIYVIHPVFRELTKGIGQIGYPYIGLFFFLLTTLFAAYVTKSFVNKINTRISKNLREI